MVGAIGFEPPPGCVAKSNAENRLGAVPLYQPSHERRAELV